jgi:hypothetical protein
MVRENQKIGWFITGVLLFVAPAAFGSCTDTPPTPAAGTACMSLLDGGTTGYPFSGIYVGPYDASINGGPSTKVICDDFFDDSFIPEYWTANVIPGGGDLSGTRMASLTHGPPLSLSGPALTAAYDEVGYLALQLLAPNDQYTEAEIHFALWSIFDPNALNYVPNVSDGHGSTYYADATNFRNAAIGAVTNDSKLTSFISQFTIYTPDAGSSVICPGNTCGPTMPPQEFLVHTPEPPFLALLGVDLSGVGALLFLVCRRRSK